MGQSVSIKRVKELELLAKPLEPDSDQRSSLNGAVFNYAEDYLAHLIDMPAYKPSEEGDSNLFRSLVIENPLPIHQVLKMLS
jgi:hypothetical protein